MARAIHKYTINIIQLLRSGGSTQCLPEATIKAGASADGAQEAQEVGKSESVLLGLGLRVERLRGLGFKVYGLKGSCKQSADNLSESEAWILSQRM